MVPLALYCTYSSPALLAMLWNSSGFALGTVALTFRKAPLMGRGRILETVPFSTLICRGVSSARPCCSQEPCHSIATMGPSCKVCDLLVTHMTFMMPLLKACHALRGSGANYGIR